MLSSSSAVFRERNMSEALNFRKCFKTLSPFLHHGESPKSLWRKGRVQNTLHSSRGGNHILAFHRQVPDLILIRSLFSTNYYIWVLIFSGDLQNTWEIHTWQLKFVTTGATDWIDIGSRPFTIFLSLLPLPHRIQRSFPFTQFVFFPLVYNLYPYRLFLAEI